MPKTRDDQDDLEIGQDDDTEMHDSKPDINETKVNKKSGVGRKDHVVALFLGFFSRVAKRNDKKIEVRRQRIRMRDIIRIIMMAKIIMQRMQKELKLSASRNNPHKKQILLNIVKLLSIAQRDRVLNAKDYDMIAMRIATISNLTDAKQSLCMRIIIDQIRFDPSFPPNIAIALESIAKNEFIRQDGTSDNTIKNHRVNSVQNEHGNVLSM